MFYYTFSVINTMFVPCTTLLYDSTAATRTLKLSTTLLSISCGIHLISLLMMSSLVCGLFSQTLSFRYPTQNIFRRVEILGTGWPGFMDLMRNESVSLEVMPGVFNCSVRQITWPLTSWQEHLNTSGISSHGTDSEKKSDGFYKKFSIELRTILMFELLLCCHTVTWCMERT